MKKMLVLSVVCMVGCFASIFALVGANNTDQLALAIYLFILFQVIGLISSHRYEKMRKRAKDKNQFSPINDPCGIEDEWLTRGY